MKSWSSRSLTSDDASLDDVVGSLDSYEDDKSPEPITDTTNLWTLGQKSVAATRRESLTNRHMTLLKVKTQQERTTTAAVPEQARRRAKVGFGIIHVYYHEIIMGDSPACSTGVPIAIGGLALETEVCTVDEFEHDRIDATKARKISSGRRERILRDAGYTKRQVQARVDQVQLLQHASQQDAPSDGSSSQRSTAYPAPKLLTLFARRNKKDNKGNVTA